MHVEMHYIETCHSAINPYALTDEAEFLSLQLNTSLKSRGNWKPNTLNFTVSSVLSFQQNPARLLMATNTNGLNGLLKQEFILEIYVVFKVLYFYIAVRFLQNCIMFNKLETRDQTKVSHSLQSQDTKGKTLPAVPVLQQINSSSPPALQMKDGPEKEEPLQLNAVQRDYAQLKRFEAPGPTKSNRTGLPDQLKAGIENLSSFSMDDVRVHYNSSKPAQLQAFAFAQGTDIHVSPGQERQLPHEAWHVVQQKQGRVAPTLQLKTGAYINDDTGLEHEADIMGARAWSMSSQTALQPAAQLNISHSTGAVSSGSPVLQGYFTHNSNELTNTELKTVRGKLQASIQDEFDTEADDESAPVSLSQWLRERAERRSVGSLLGSDMAVSDEEEEEEDEEGKNQKMFNYDTDDEESMTSTPSGVAHIRRKGTGTVIPSHEYTGDQAAMYIARNIRGARGAHDPANDAPIVTTLNSHNFEMAPSAWRKDVAVFPMTRTGSGYFERQGSAERYATLAKKIEDEIEESGVEYSKANQYLRSTLNKEAADLKLLNGNEELSKHLSLLAGILLADIARSSLAIDKVIETLDDDSSFLDRFGTKVPSYIGAPKGGSKKLQEYTKTQKEFE